MTKEEMNRMKYKIAIMRTGTAIMKTMVKFAKKYGDKVVLSALRNLVNDVNKVIEEYNNRKG